MKILLYIVKQSQAKICKTNFEVQKYGYMEVKCGMTNNGLDDWRKCDKL